MKISSNAFDALNSSILAIDLVGIANAKSFNSWSTSSHTFLFSTIPPKYLLDIAIVLLTKFPKTLARSLLILSTNKSHVILPSLSYGISCNTKYLTASTPKISTKSSA